LRGAGEDGAVGLELARSAIVDDPEIDGNIVEPAERQQPNLIAELLGAPDRGLGPEPDVAVLLGSQSIERRRCVDMGLYELAVGKLLGELAHVARREGLAVIDGTGERGRDGAELGEGSQHPCGSRALEKLATAMCSCHGEPSSLPRLCNIVVPAARLPQAS
jgi:hypothetical protein